MNNIDIGDIVLYQYPLDRPAPNNATVVPAIVVRKWSDSCVNLRVLCDGKDMPPWFQSVEHGCAPGCFITVAEANRFDGDRENAFSDTKTVADCAAKFDNDDKFGGRPAAPVIEPAPAESAASTSAEPAPPSSE